METVFEVGPYRFAALDIAGVLNAALDTAYGVSYRWAVILEKIEPTRWDFESDPGVHYREEYPINPGGGLLMKDTEADDAEAKLIDWDAVQHGLCILCEKYPEHFQDIVFENADATTGDVLVQCALFGDIVY